MRRALLGSGVLLLTTEAAGLVIGCFDYAADCALNPELTCYWAGQGGESPATPGIGWLLPWVLYLLVCVVGAIRGFQGRMNTRSLLGRLVEWMLGQDRSVAPLTPPGP